MFLSNFGWMLYIQYYVFYGKYESDYHITSIIGLILY